MNYKNDIIFWYSMATVVLCIGAVFEVIVTAEVFCYLIMARLVRIEGKIDRVHFENNPS